MSFSTCPFCDDIIPSSEIERHANNHFEEEELARDMEVAQQIALASTSPHRITDNQMDNDSSFGSFSGEDPKTSTSICNTKINDHGETLMQDKVSFLVSLQIRSSFYKVEGGLMALLRRCLQLETEHSTSIICVHVDHFQSVESEDRGWGCGWRNIQMLCSNLLMQRQEAKEMMFGGSGFVPDIPSLQRWLEIAWERDFDMLGSDSFNYKIYGTTKWIGATECATLFRSFGLRARIVDFGNKEIESLWHGANRGTKKGEMNSRDKRKVEQVYGPMDKFLQADPSRQRESTGLGSKTGDDQSTSKTRDWDRSIKEDNKLNKLIPRKTKGHQVLIDWVWNYFADKKFNELGDHQRVIVSEKTPLYFQHDGHSRTIVGIQVKQPLHGRPKQYTLLILDPGHRTEALEKSLRGNFGWQRHIKRGVHTLKKPQYQLCYIDPGVADEKEVEQLKTIDSIYFES